MKLRQLTVAAAIGVLTACSGGAGDPPTAPPASTDIASVIIRPATGAFLGPGSSYRLEAYPYAASGVALSGVRGGNWASANPTIATVTPDGVVATIAPGPFTVTMSATVTGSSKTFQGSATLTVEAPHVDSIRVRVTPFDKTLPIGFSFDNGLTTLVDRQAIFWTPATMNFFLPPDGAHCAQVAGGGAQYSHILTNSGLFASFLTASTVQGLPTVTGTPSDPALVYVLSTGGQSPYFCFRVPGTSVLTLLYGGQSRSVTVTASW